MMSWRLVPSCGDVVGTGGDGGETALGSRGVDGGGTDWTWDSPWQSYCWATCAERPRVGLAAVGQRVGFESAALVALTVDCVCLA